MSSAPNSPQPSAETNKTLGAMAPEESLIKYPSAFPIKVLGPKVEGFEAAIAHVAKQFDPDFDAATIVKKDSSGGNYLGLTITITATSREQLDELYRTLSTHPMVKWVL